MPAPRGQRPGPKNPGAAPATQRPGVPAPRLAGQPARAAPAPQKPRKVLPGAIVGTLVEAPRAAPARAAPPPASVIRAAQSGAPVSKSQAKRNRKKLREAGSA